MFLCGTGRILKERRQRKVLYFYFYFFFGNIFELVAFNERTT